MGIPILQMAQICAYVVRQRLAGRKRFPLVLMLEPLFRCNLACAGCGKIDYPEKISRPAAAIADCLAAIDECGAPFGWWSPAASRCCTNGSSPDREGRDRQDKFVTVCTNALLLREKSRSLYARPLLQLVDLSRWRHGNA